MNILIVSPNWPSNGVSANGVVTYYRYLKEELEARGCKVFVLTVFDDDTEIATEVFKLCDFVKKDTGLGKRVFEKLFPSSMAWLKMGRKIAYAVAEICEAKDIHLIEIEESFGWSRPVSRCTTAPVVVRLHGPHFVNGVMTGKPLKISDYVRMLVERCSLKRAKYVTSPSQWLGDLVKARYKCTWEYYSTIPNPIELDRNARWLCNEHSPNTVLFVGRFDRHKGGDLVLRAFEICRARCRDLELVFIGPDVGVAVDGVSYCFKRYCEKFISAETLAGIHYLGTQPREVIEDWRQKTTMTILASRNENFPYTGVEALAQGVPCIAPRVGGINEIFDHEINSLMFDGSDVNGLANGILRLLEEPDTRKRIAKRAFEYADQTYSTEKIVSRTLSFYESVLSESV